ncbi:MAG: sulfatase-like hydrolase/transferase [Pirellulaceae bacterium]|nr:sulfatase-like hydrolase/transferase [Pirellulaceae bacterium]
MPNFTPEDTAADRPNIILIYTDDVDCESLFSTRPEQPADKIPFPALRQLAENGTCFTNFHVTTPICGPSRASLLSGRYAHHNQVRVNNPNKRSANGFSGGYEVFDREYELGSWMQQAGYNTAWVGKYLHDGFSPREEKQETWKSISPKGWNTFYCMTSGNYRNFGRVGTGIKGFSRINDHYRTDYEADLVSQLLEGDLASDARPFFLCWAPFAAHLALDLETMDTPRHLQMHVDETPSGVLNFSAYENLQNQPQELANILSPTPELLKYWKSIHQKRLRAMQGLDEGIAKLMASLKRSGKLDNTIVFFTSDHGFSNGQLRHYGKRLPTDRVTKVPFIASGGGVPQGRQCNELLANIDIAPTLLALAGAKIPTLIDGTSFANLLHSPDSSWERPAIIIENWDRIWCNGDFLDIAYCSYRDQQRIYTEWASGSRSLFDVATDPEQVHNIYSDLSPSEQQAWAKKLKALRSQNRQMPPVISSQFIYPEIYEENKVISGNFLPVEFSGYVESDIGIESVDLEIFAERINSYWDGEKWTKEAAVMPAELTMPKGHLSQWSGIIDTQKIAFDRDQRMNRRDAIVNVIATDQDGQQTRWDNAFEFKMKINDPETWINPPAEWSREDGKLIITGRAADNFEMSNVKMLVFNLDQKTFWDGANQKWTDERVTMDTEIEFLDNQDQPGSWATWRYTYNGPQKGRLFFLPRGHDAERKFDMSPPFEIVNFDEANN